ncbi:hypothetical protein ACJRO7_019987 [Eucalyptus globulus]|uniref:Xylanase inhibitor C-terminal domain-containing protein n=1 Tax=Eucalyptus globulus TaxID=34317 RepID=A0ABD3KKZ1_EUCGL
MKTMGSSTTPAWHCRYGRHWSLLAYLRDRGFHHWPIRIRLLPRPGVWKGLSKISFSEDAMISGPGAVSTPLVSIGPYPYYVLKLEGFSVGKTRFSYGDNSTNSEAKESINVMKMVINSATFLTAVAEAIPLLIVPDPKGKLGLCYASLGNEIDVPVVMLHFASGTDVALNIVNTFTVQRNTNISGECRVVSVLHSVLILGNLAQVGFKVGFDLRKRMASFMPITDCTAQRNGMI